MAVTRRSPKLEKRVSGHSEKRATTPKAPGSAGKSRARRPQRPGRTLGRGPGGLPTPSTDDEYSVKEDFRNEAYSTHSFTPSPSVEMTSPRTTRRLSGSPLTQTAVAHLSHTTPETIEEVERHGNTATDAPRMAEPRPVSKIDVSTEDDPISHPQIQRTLDFRRSQHTYPRFIYLERLLAKVDRLDRVNRTATNSLGYHESDVIRVQTQAKSLAGTFKKDLESLITGSGPTPRSSEKHFQDILNSGLLDEWWDSVMVFLYNGHRYITYLRSIGANAPQLLWLQAVEVVRTKYRVHGLQDSLLELPKGPGEFLKGVKVLKFISKPPLWFDFNRECRNRFSARDGAVGKAELDRHVRYLTSTMDDLETDPAHDLEMACTILIDLKAIRNHRHKLQIPASQVYESLLMIYKEWMNAKRPKFVSLVSEINNALDVLDYDDGTLEVIEQTFERVSLHARRLTYLSIMSSTEASGFKERIRARLDDFREKRYSNGPEVAQLWYMIWKSVEKLHERVFHGDFFQELDRPSLHKSRDIRFMLAEHGSFAAIHESYIYSRRLIHLVVAKYCDAIYAESMSARADTEQFLKPGFIHEWRTWVSDPDPGPTEDAFHSDLHATVLRFLYLCRNIGLDFSARHYRKAMELQESSPFTTSTPLVSPKIPRTPPYIRVIPCGGAYLLPETSAIADAHSERIHRALTEPGVEESTEPYLVDFRVPPVFTLPGVKFREYMFQDPNGFLNYRDPTPGPPLRFPVIPGEEQATRTPERHSEEKKRVTSQAFWPMALSAESQAEYTSNALTKLSSRLQETEMRKGSKSGSQ